MYVVAREGFAHMIQYDAHMVIGIINDVLFHTEYVRNVEGGVFKRDK
jgi:hypothetical protein